jgi:glyoxylase-like metal-dependent hydrolase (beta-lactamase superfamily II)
MTDRVKVGNAEIAMVWETEYRYAPSQFMPSMPRETWQALLGGSDPDEIIESRVMTYLIRSQGKNVLVDAGVGQHGIWRFGDGHLVDSLKELDVTPEDIDFVVPTHLHGDHVGGFTTPTPDGLVPTFPNARYMIQKADWDHFIGDDPESWVNNPAPNQRMHAAAVVPLKNTGLLELIGPEQIITDGVTILHTPGHTVGSVSVLVQNGAEAALLVGDALHNPAQLTEPDFSPAVDIDPSLSARSRRAILEQAQKANAYVAGGHFGAPGHPAFGRVLLMDGRPIWQGVSL